MSKRKIKKEFIIRYITGRYKLKLENIKTQNFATMWLIPKRVDKFSKMKDLFLFLNPKLPNSKKTQKNFHFIISSCLLAYKASEYLKKDVWIHYSKKDDTDFYKNNKKLSHHIIADFFIPEMIKQSYLDYQKGFHWKGGDIAPKIKPTQKLINELLCKLEIDYHSELSENSLIRVKNKDKTAYIRFKKTPSTENWESILHEMNERIQNRNLYLHLPSLKEYKLTEGYPYICTSDSISFIQKSRSIKEKYNKVIIGVNRESNRERIDRVERESSSSDIYRCVLGGEIIQWME